MSEPKVVSTEEYLRSLSIPQFPLNFEAEDQLKIHLMCAMLCCPKQIADDGTLSVHEINKNIWQVSEHFLDLYVIARDATKDDEIEFSKIAGNLERIFQLPLFSDIVQMNPNGKFYAVPPPPLRNLYTRILRGGASLRRREGATEAKKLRENETPEAVYRAKVACNFLMELIERERNYQAARYVDWQSVQKRYQEMVANENSEDRKLMQVYKVRYGLEFGPSLNGEMMKKWTGRSSLSKGLSMPLFHKIYFEMKPTTGTILVGFRDDESMYDEKELLQSKAEWDAEKQGNSRRFDNNRRKPAPAEVVKKNELEGVIPLRERRARNASMEPAVVPDYNSSPFAAKAEPYSRTTYHPVKPPMSDGPEYIPSSIAPVSNDSDSETASDDEKSEDGFYSDEEQIANKEEGSQPASQAQKNDFATTGGWKTPETEAQPKPQPKPERYPSVKPLFEHQTEMRRPEPPGPEQMSNAPPPRLNQWEFPDQVPPIVKPSPIYEAASSATPHAPVTPPCNNVAAPHPPSTSRHLSAFEACKPTSTTQEKRVPESKPANDGRRPSASARNEPPPRSLYASRVNAEYQKEMRGLRDEGIRNNEQERYQESAAARETHLPEERNYRQSLPDRDRRYENDRADRRNYQEDSRSTQGYGQSDRRDYRESNCSRQGHDQYDARDHRDPGRPAQDYDNASRNRSDYRDGGHSTQGYNNARREVRDANNESVFSRLINENSIVRDPPRMASRQESNRDRQSSRASVYNGQCSRPEADRQRPFQEAEFIPEDSQRYRHDARDDEYRYRNYNSPRPSNLYSPEKHRGDFSERPGFSESRHSMAPSPVPNNFGADSNYYREAFRHSSDQPLTEEERSSLRMIREYVYLHRDYHTFGFRPVDSVLPMLPGGRNRTYWVSLIRAHLPSVELVPFRDSFMMVWNDDGEPM